MRIVGPHTNLVVGTVSKSHTAVSRSTPESEVVALDHVLRTMAIPASELLSAILQRPVTPTLKEDNQACVQVINTGCNPTMRHMARAHHVIVEWIQERFKAGGFKLDKIGTDAHAADISAKAFTNKDKWVRVRKRINACELNELFDATQMSGGGAATLLSNPKTIQNVNQTCQVVGKGRYIQYLDCSGRVATQQIHPNRCRLCCG